MITNKLINFFPRFELEASRNLDFYLALITPFFIAGYFIALGVSSSLDNFFGVMLLVFGLILWLKYRRFDVPVEMKRIYIMGLLVFLMVVLHAVIGRDIEMLFKFQFENLRNLLLLPFLALLLVTVNLNAQGVWRLIVITGLYTLVFSILILIEDPVRGEGLLRKAIVIGNLGMLFALASLVAFFGIKGKFWKALALLVFFSGFLLSVLTQTRAGWVAFLIAVVLLAWTFWQVNRRNFYILMGCFVALSVLLIIFWSHLPIEQRILQAVNDISLYNDGFSNTSVGQRFDMWVIAFHAFLEKPIFGWGVTPFKETFFVFLERDLVNYQIPADGGGFAQPHNDYIFLLYHFGLVGFLMAMSIVIYPGYLFIKHINKYKKTNHEQAYIALTGLVVIEALLDFMLFNLAMMNKIFYVAVIIIFMILYATLKYDNLNSTNNCNT
ncbi:O-antigen ligase family protein [Thiomicrospira aerophila]|nr:O-antigen ligase family protein [Thiomicrospira aerophila]